MDGTEIENQSSTTAKQGHSCFGFCCDMRRAVVIVNIFTIVAFILQIIILVAITRRARGDDGFDELVAIEKALTGIIIMSVIGWFIAFYAMYGAIKYKIIPVALQVGYSILFWLASNSMQTRASHTYPDYRHTWFNWVLTLVTTSLFVYPHVMFILEVRGGIMAAETYAREKQSCCCV